MAHHLEISVNEPVFGLAAETYGPPPSSRIFAYLRGKTLFFVAAKKREKVSPLTQTPSATKKNFTP
jgi:hypothetical protein